MSDNSVMDESFDSITTLAEKSCKCIQQIICELNGEDSDVMSDRKIQQDVSVEYLCDSSSRPQVSTSSKTSRSLVGNLNQSSPDAAEDNKLINNSVYTAKEIEEFTRIIQDAIYNELPRKIPDSRKSSSDKSIKLAMSQPHFQKDDCCWCDDDFSLRKMTSMVLDQLSLMRKYNDVLCPDPITLKYENSLQCVRKETLRLDESKSHEIQLENQKFNVDRESLDHEVSYDEDNQRSSDMEIKNESNSCVLTMNANNSKVEENSKTKACRKMIKTCKPRSVLVRLDFNKSLDHLDCEDVEPFTIGSQGRSDLIGKWGKCQDIVNQLLSEQDVTIRGKIMPEKVLGTSESFNELEEEKTLTCIRYDEEEDDHDKISKKQIENAKYVENKKVVCTLRSHKCREIFPGVRVFAADDFDNLKRFDDIGNRGVASLCRTLIRWTHCVTKTLCEIRKHPHLVIQMPSFSYPKRLRIRAMRTFKTLQNIQFGRLAWIGNENTQVLYVCPNLDDVGELPTLLRELVGRVRPDVSLDNLWIIRSNDFRKSRYSADNCCASGIENLFASPRTYRRVRNLTAGRQAFILPGVMDEKDVFVACELKIPIMGISLNRQNYFQLKSEFMKLLNEFDIKHPPSLDVHDFSGLCEGFARMIIDFPIHHTWLVKINIGFNGYQTAVVNFHTKLLNSVIRDKSRCALNMEEKWTSLFMEILPAKLEFNRDVYQNYKQFICDLDCHGKFKYTNLIIFCTSFIEFRAHNSGGIIQACPEYKYKSISLGIAIEHDTALPKLLTTADVLQFKDDIRNDVGYVIPQTTVRGEKLQELTRKIGMALRRDGLVGFFGIDLVAFTNKSNEEELWVVDLDPHYTDLQAFSDWIKFCLRSGESCDIMRPTERKVTRESVRENLWSMRELEKELPNNRIRYTVASGKLFTNGLSEYSANALINLCRDRHVHYDHIELRGCMLCPVDPEFRAICLISIYPTRQLAIRKFIEALRILHELSNDKRKCIETNILKLARDLAHEELNSSAME